MTGPERLLSLLLPGGRTAGARDEASTEAAFGADCVQILRRRALEAFFSVELPRLIAQNGVDEDDAVAVDEGWLWDVLGRFFGLYFQDGQLDPCMRRSGERVAPWGDSDTMLHWLGRGSHYVSAGDRRGGLLVHAGLGPFLRRELDGFLREELLEPDSLAGEGVLARVLSRLRALRVVGCAIIARLHEVESLLAMLLERRRLVVGSGWLVPIRLVPELLWERVLACEPQRRAWRELLRLDGPVDRSFLAMHPSLPVDTRHFGDAFAEEVLSSFEDLEEHTDGILVHADNYAALRTLEAVLAGRVGRVFIDPPYNTGSAGFRYEDDFGRHSNWLTMMEPRLWAARRLMALDGLFFATIDSGEAARLRLLLDHVFGADAFLADIAWEKRFTRSNNANLFYSLKDTVMAYRAGSAVARLRERRSGRSRGRYCNPDSDPRGPWLSSSYVNPATRARRPNLVYPISNPHTGEDVEHPTHAWKYDRETHRRHVAEGRLYWGQSGTYRFPRLKSFLADASDGVVPVDVWRHDDTGTTDEGGRRLKALFGWAAFDNPKPPSLVRRCLELRPESAGDVVLDFFAGSGTTADAVMGMNRAGAERRRFVLVESGAHFETVLVARVQKVMYSEGWVAGVPADPTVEPGAVPEWVVRSPRLVRVLELERFEDNLTALASDGAELLTALASDGADQRHLLESGVPAEGASLDVPHDMAFLEHPFELRPPGALGAVDIPTTFALVMGLRTRRVRSAEHQGRRYLLLEAGAGSARVLTVWRDTRGLDVGADREFLEAAVPDLLGAPITAYECVWQNRVSTVANGSRLDETLRDCLRGRERWT